MAALKLSDHIVSAYSSPVICWNGLLSMHAACVHQHILVWTSSNLLPIHSQHGFDGIVVLQTIIHKFPEELVDAWCEVFFLPLVQRLTSDSSSQCREAVGACLRALMLRSGPEPLDKLSQYCLIWLGGGDPRLARAAAQVCDTFPAAIFCMTFMLFFKLKMYFQTICHLLNNTG